jgi:putative ABC transport system ATP-binding protein
MISLKKAVHHYDRNNHVALPDIELETGKELLVMGLSGSGKSTLLHILAGLLRPTTGKLTINGTDVYALSESDRDRFRGRHAGVIFQQIHLVNSLTVRDNLRLAQYMAGVKNDDARILNLCDSLGIADKMNSYTDQLSQGQKQRVGIARAVINEPDLLLADEPTSSLDDKRSRDVINLLKEQASRHGASLIISTHDQRVKDHFTRTVSLDELNMEKQ